MQNSRLTPQEKNFPRWYQDIVREAGLAEASEVRGCGIVKPYGYKIWELIKSKFSTIIENKGVENVYFPIFIPMSNLESEKEHVEGFSPELAIVTIGGGEKLSENLVVRPTSETGMYKAYSKWIQSYKDLPLKLNQWNNVVRWEKRPRAFLRWSEFLWQEGHTAFATEEDALNEMWEMLDSYEEIYRYMSIPVYKGIKSQKEKFAGAVITSCVEIVTKDGKAIQGATSHHLGQNFSKVFDIKYLGKDGKTHYVYQNSWGFAWRSIAAIVMVHGDNKGLKLPPSVAPYQIVIVPIYKETNKTNVLNYCEKLGSQFTNYRVKFDMRDDLSPGYKFNDWEMKGVPIRLEIGENELKDNTVTIYRRDTNSKEVMKVDELKNSIESIFKNIDSNLYQKACELKDSLVTRISNWDEIKGKKGFFEASWCESIESELTLKEKFKITSRVLVKENINKKSKEKKCFVTGTEAKRDWLFAKSY